MVTLHSITVITFVYTFIIIGKYTRGTELCVKCMHQHSIEMNGFVRK